MDISVEYKDSTGAITNRIYRLTRLAFAKHLAIAGQGFAPKLNKLFRTVAMFFHYSNYLQRRSFDNNRFSLPPDQFYDPTEKGQFSNLVGKAIADFLSKRIDQSFYTVNYEAAMKLRRMYLNVRRPDLLAFNSNGQFAIEAKGFSGGHKDMNTHKIQSQTGGIPVNFSIACVSYRLYENIQCKYYYPSNDNIPFNDKLFNGLTKSYYSGLLEFLDQKFFEYRDFEFNGERFYEIQLTYRTFEKIFPEEFPLHPHWYFDLLEFYRPSLLLPFDIREYAKNGLTKDIKPFVFDLKQEDNYIYIDNDRVGLRIRR